MDGALEPLRHAVSDMHRLRMIGVTSICLAAGGVLPFKTDYRNYLASVALRRT